MVFPIILNPRLLSRELIKLAKVCQAPSTASISNYDLKLFHCNTGKSFCHKITLRKETTSIFSIASILWSSLNRTHCRTCIQYYDKTAWVPFTILLQVLNTAIEKARYASYSVGSNSIPEFKPSIVFFKIKLRLLFVRLTSKTVYTYHFTLSLRKGSGCWTGARS